MILYIYDFIIGFNTVGSVWVNLVIIYTILNIINHTFIIYIVFSVIILLCFIV